MTVPRIQPFFKKRHHVSTSRPINYSEKYFLPIPKGNT